jgi:hypothetical protein
LVNGMGGVGKTAICRELMHHATNPANTMLDVTVLYKQVKTIDFHLSQLTNVAVTAEHSGNALQHDRQLQLHEHLSKLFQLANLTADEKDILRTLAVLPCQNYHCHDELMVWLGLDNPELLGILRHHTG